MIKYDKYINQGKRQEQLDDIFILNSIQILDIYFNIYMVIDSHENKESSEYFKEIFTLLITNYNNKHYTNFTTYFNDLFKEIDDKIAYEKKKGGFVIGLVLLSDKINLSVTIGDVVVCVKNKNNIYISEKHNFDNRQEMKRFENLLIENRYKLLNMSRCIGDFNKKEKNKNLLLPYPTISIIKEWDIIYIYSDGLPFNILKDNDYDLNLEDLKKIQTDDNIGIIKIINE